MHCSVFQVDPSPPGTPKSLRWGSFTTGPCASIGGVICWDSSPEGVLRIQHYKICIRLWGARAPKKGGWKMANVCMLPLYIPLCLLLSGEVLGEYSSCWWRKAREEKGCICQEEMQSWFWLGMINSTCCSEIWLWTGHIPLISLQLAPGDPSAVVDVNKPVFLYQLRATGIYWIAN